jgi:hypothetical protein
MKHLSLRRHGPSLSLALALALMPAAPVLAGSYTLYDGSLNTAPADQGWLSSVPSGAVQTVGSGSVTLDTTSSNGLKSGYSLMGGMLPLVLNSSGGGFRLSFDAQVLTETHANNNRAGFSVIVLDSAQRGVEIGFWSDAFWAQSTSFLHAETAAFDTTAGLTHYDLTLANGSYTLAASRAGSAGATLTGVLRDYPAALFTPYDIPNFLFLGDDTTSAAGSFRLAQVDLTAIPEPAVPMLLTAAALALALRRKSGRLWG